MSTNNILTQNDHLKSSLDDYFSDEKKLSAFLHVITGESKISLRIMDWFVTNYSKKNSTIIYNKIKQNTERFKVYEDYKLNLRAFSKKRFDPFCRRERTYIKYNNDQMIETTLAQQNFFKWAIDNNIIDYIISNYDAISADMVAVSTSIKNRPKNPNEPKTRKKREELSISATKIIKKDRIEICLKFD